MVSSKVANGSIYFCVGKQDTPKGGGVQKIGQIIMVVGQFSRVRTRYPTHDAKK